MIGGSIKIGCKYINQKEDFTVKNELKFEKLLEKSKNGMIEITVTDTGIGIKDEDLNKLFNLFGFLDSSKEINT